MLRPAMWASPIKQFPVRWLRQHGKSLAKAVSPSGLEVRHGSFTTDAFATRADQCPLLLVVSIGGRNTLS